MITFPDFLYTNYVICSAVMVKKSLLEEVSLFPEEKEYTAIEDYILWLRLSSKIDFLYISQPLVKYYDDPKLSIRVFYNNVNDIQKAVFKNFINWLDENQVHIKMENEKQFALACEEVFNGKTPSMFRKLKRRLKI